MRTIVLMLCLALLGGTVNTATAQSTTKQKLTLEESATKRTEKLTEALKLNANQQKQVYNLILEQGKKKEEINNTKLTQDERRTNMKQLRASFDTQLKGVLSAEQYQTYLAKKEEMKNHKHHGEHPKGGKK